MKKILGALALLVALVFVPATFDSAQAVPGCRTKVINKVDGWQLDTTYPAPVPGGVEHRKVRLIANAHYQHCPNGRRPNKIKIKFLDLCWTHIHPRVSSVFGGAKFNGYFFDDYGDSNPPQQTVQKESGRQRCEIQDIKESDEEWLSMAHSPAWTMSSWIILNYAPDQHHDFKAYESSNNRIKYFHPSKDLNTSGWHW